jgi:hypothetical protein
MGVSMARGSALPKKGALMRLSKLSFCIATVALLFLQFSPPAHADTFQIVALSNDNVGFYGMDDSGHVVLLANGFGCGNSTVQCYEDFLNGMLVSETGVAPTLAWDYSEDNCGLPPCTISKDGRSAVIVSEPPGDGLFVGLGSNPPQLLTVGGFSGTHFAMNGLGDIVFDDGNADEWFEAIDLSTAPVPETTSILLLGTGAISLARLIPRRKRTA